MSRQRVRAGRIEKFCDEAGIWWWALVGHIHRHHRSKCRCLAVCAPLIRSGKVQRDDGRKSLRQVVSQMSGRSVA